MSKATRQLQCSTSFFLNFCIFQHLYNGRVKEIGKERDSLYYLLSHHKLPGPKKQVYDLSVKIFNLADVCQAGIELWHKRLGYMPSKVLSYLFPNQQSHIKNTMKSCSVCPCAR